MKLKVRKSAIVHYFIIWVMIMMNDTFLYRNVLNKYGLAVLGACIALMIIYRKTIDSIQVLFTGFLLISVALVRLNVGGIGIEAWLTWATMIFVSVIAIRFDIDKFWDRFGNVVYFYALVSLIYFVVSLVSPEIIKQLSVFKALEIETITEWFTAERYNIQSNYVYGFFIYSLRDYAPTRNNSVFGEPGLYQIVLNTLVFALLFFRKKFTFSDRKVLKILIVCSLAIVTSQSTSGLLSLIVIFVGFLLERKIEIDNHSNSVKSLVRRFAIIGILMILLDYIVRGEGSLLYSVVLRKLFNEGSFSLSADTGSFRMITLLGSLSVLFTNPFGTGYDFLTEFFKTFSSGEYVGARIFYTFAALGIIPTIVIIIWYLHPILSSRKGFWFKTSFLFFLINTLIMQSKEFYPCLVLIPIYLSVCRQFRINPEDGLDYNSFGGEL